MPEDLARVVEAALKVIDIIFGIWVDLNAAQPLTGEGTSLVQGIADVAVVIAKTAALLALNNPL